MKKIAYISSYILITFFAACTKNNDNIKQQLEKALPTIEVSSLGLSLQTGPFAQTDVLQVTFGGAITGATPGAFDYAWYDAPATGSPNRIDSVHFASWTEAAAASNGSNAIATTLTASTYPTTNTFTGNLVMKLTKLPTGSKSYSLKVYARTSDSKMATFSITKFITIK